ncbi:LuxR C-terminal-related transcriptional regulator [Dehalobacter sp. DCM]|uniref:helix-turn-helix transcriptional regulator n=1 Tax=Dehalobacter sp. DCM TaxID=2907827 RepID=UPI00308215BB|nr:LuxR C-terminal-related transcriptional regulator [Dehalobacter sp. DCM]
MSDRQSTDVEDILEAYYRKLDEIQVKEIVIKTIEKNVGELRRMLLDVNELVPSKDVISVYGGILGGAGYVCEASAQSYPALKPPKDRIEKELVKLRQRRIKLKMQIVYLESAIEGISFAMSLLDPIDRTICEGCYGLKGKSNMQISQELNMDEKTIRNRRKKIMLKLTMYLHLNSQS